MTTTAHHADEIAALLVTISALETTKLCEIWQETLSDEDQVLLYAEYTAILLSFTDRLADKMMSATERVGLLSPVQSELEQAFSRRKNFGTTDQERVFFYRNFLKQRMEGYARCPSILGKHEGQFAFTAASLLVENLLPKERAPEKERLLLETGKSVSRLLIATLTTEPFRMLTGAPGLAVEEPQDRVMTPVAEKRHSRRGRESTVAFRLGRWVRRRLG